MLPIFWAALVGQYLGPGTYFLMALGSGTSSCAGFVDPVTSGSQIIYPEERPGTSGRQAEAQVGSFLLTQLQSQAPEFIMQR